jgi:hypothetical protein
MRLPVIALRNVFQQRQLRFCMKIQPYFKAGIALCHTPMLAQVTFFPYFTQLLPPPVSINYKPNQVHFGVCTKFFFFCNCNTYKLIGCTFRQTCYRNYFYSLRKTYKKIEIIRLSALPFANNNKIKCIPVRGLFFINKLTWFRHIFPSLTLLNFLKREYRRTCRLNTLSEYQWYDVP